MPNTYKVTIGSTNTSTVFAPDAGQLKVERFGGQALTASDGERHHDLLLAAQ